MHIREVAPTELACCMRSCVRPVRLIQSWLRRKRARSQRCSFESPSVAYDSPEHCQSTKHGSTSNRTTSQKIKVRVYPITCPLCKGLVTNERMGVTADVRVRNMGTISCRPRTPTRRSSATTRAEHLHFATLHVSSFWSHCNRFSKSLSQPSIPSSTDLTHVKRQARGGALPWRQFQRPSDGLFLPDTRDRSRLP